MVNLYCHVPHDAISNTQAILAADHQCENTLLKQKHRRVVVFYSSLLISFVKPVNLRKSFFSMTV